MTKELYINGQLCDLEDTPSLIFQSPVFNDLDVIQSNRSAEINLPLTPRNRKAFGLIDRIDILDDSAAYRKHSAAYYLGGFPIFTRGYAMVTDVTDTINITLVWGDIDNFQPLFDASLRDLREQIIEVARRVKAAGATAVGVGAANLVEPCACRKIICFAAPLPSVIRWARITALCVPAP